MASKISIVIGAAALLASLSAHAVTLVPVQTGDGQYSASFEGSHTLSGTYADNYDFASPIAGLLTIALDSDSPAGFAGVAFLGYELTGGPVIQFDQFSHVVIGPLTITEGPQLLTLGLIAAPALAADVAAATGYSGTITINALPIPEPDIWLMMVTGGLLLVATKRRTSPKAPWYSPPAAQSYPDMPWSGADEKSTFTHFKRRTAATGGGTAVWPKWIKWVFPPSPVSKCGG